MAVKWDLAGNLCLQANRRESLLMNIMYQVACYAANVHISHLFIAHRPFVAHSPVFGVKPVLEGPPILQVFDVTLILPRWNQSL